MDIKGWSLKEKIGQMFIIAFGGEEMTPELKRAIVELNVGGVILFQRNLKNIDKVVKLNRDIQMLAKAKGRPPLWISIDQEGGGISYLWEGMVLSPGNMLIGASENEGNAYDAAYIMGVQLKKLGFNMNFAPDIDINNNPRNPVIGARSFGENPQKVSRLGEKTIQGYCSAGILAVGKHYPGHGDTELDSHLSLPKVEKNLDELEQFELLPFIENIKSGMEAVMTAHILFPKLDDEYPATLSSYFLKKLLRDRYDFDGLILTDSMEMHAISKFYGREEGTVKAVQAGADIILACGKDVVTQELMIDAVEQAVRKGVLKEETIQLAVDRVMRFKEKWIGDGGVEDIDLHSLTQKSYEDNMLRIAKEGITLQFDNSGVLPLTMEEKVKVISQRTYNDENYVGDRKSIVHKIFHENRYDVTFLEGSCPSDTEVERLPETVEKDQYVLLLVNERRALPHSWVDLYEKLSAKSGKVIVVSLWNPQIVEHFPESMSTYITTYSYTHQVMEALKGLLEGHHPFKGKSPVRLLERKATSCGQVPSKGGTELEEI
ncbi:beta-N-acetylhexosaminidase [Bacillus tianshenii]|uniref:Beta-N-acetylhexosaminidase n=1 Tax=Sutcliffiella tianshenii TaxID=1463404 RepID=A0ABS2NW37_9BACI|nr:beta-N-acetylhexosaminidase [Bacillus tianshenii]MBM7618455.1 beta-N-acetylhexosaminidase [Bacillus tianshenii]